MLPQGGRPAAVLRASGSCVVPLWVYVSSPGSRLPRSTPAARHYASPTSTTRHHDPAR